jgi:hypothetical protein
MEGVTDLWLVVLKPDASGKKFNVLSLLQFLAVRISLEIRISTLPHYASKLHVENIISIAQKPIAWWRRAFL